MTCIVGYKHTNDSNDNTFNLRLNKKNTGHPLHPFFLRNHRWCCIFFVLGTDGNLSAPSRKPGQTLESGFADKHWFLKKNATPHLEKPKVKNDTNVWKYFERFHQILSHERLFDYLYIGIKLYLRNSISKQWILTGCFRLPLAGSNKLWQEKTT